MSTKVDPRALFLIFLAAIQMGGQTPSDTGTFALSPAAGKTVARHPRPGSPKPSPRRNQVTKALVAYWMNAQGKPGTPDWLLRPFQKIPIVQPLQPFPVTRAWLMGGPERSKPGETRFYTLGPKGPTFWAVSPFRKLEIDPVLDPFYNPDFWPAPDLK